MMVIPPGRITPPLLDLPQSAHSVSLFSHQACMPFEPFELAPVVILLAIAGAGMWLAPVAFRRLQFSVR